MSGLRPNRPPAKALQAEITAENEQQRDPESGPGNEDSVYPALDDLLAQAEARIEAAQDDGMWVTHFMIWLELHRLFMTKGQLDCDNCN